MHSVPKHSSKVALFFLSSCLAVMWSCRPASLVVPENVCVGGGAVAAAVGAQVREGAGVATRVTGLFGGHRRLLRCHRHLLHHPWQSPWQHGLWHTCMHLTHLKPWASALDFARVTLGSGAAFGTFLAAPIFLSASRRRRVSPTPKCKTGHSRA